MGDGQSKQCPQCKCIFESDSSETLCNDCAEENRKKETPLAVHCKFCNGVFLVPEGVNEESFCCDECKAAGDGRHSIHPQILQGASFPDTLETVPVGELKISELKQKMPAEVESTESATHSVGSIQGVEVVGMTDVTIPTEGYFQWKGYGLRINAPKESLPAGMDEARTNIKASLCGDFELPEDSDLLSCIFWISSPCKFTKPVTLEIQHCALTDDETVLSDLSFVSAKCSQKGFPYRFKQLDGGVFTMHNSYGSIQLSHFSGFGIIGRKKTPRSYCAHLYSSMKHMCDWRYYFVITQDIDAKNKVVKEHYHFARKNGTIRVHFERSEITLDIPDAGLMTGGWIITPFSHPTISRIDADQFKPGQWIPECQLVVQWERKDQKPAQLRQKVVLIGATAPHNFINLILNPATEEVVMHSSTSSGTSMDYSQAGLDSEPEFPELMNEVAAVIPHKWKDVGLQLGLDPSVLDAIDSNTRGNTNHAYSAIFDSWKKLNSSKHTYTWSTVVRVLQTPAVGEKKLADKIKDKVTKQK